MTCSLIGWWSSRASERADHLGHLRVASSATALAAVLACQAPTTVAISTAAYAKTPGKTYCFFGQCHRVRTIDETRRAIGANSVVKASYYSDPRSDRYNPSNLTSSGEWFRSDRSDNAASPIWPDGTKVLVWNPSNKRSAVLRINNAGPYWGNRQLDVSRATAEKLGFVNSGVATLHTKVVAAPTAAEATYRKGRQYPAVPGFLGAFDSIDYALLEVGRAVHNIFTSPAPAVAGRDPDTVGKPQRMLVASAESEVKTRSVSRAKVEVAKVAEAKSKTEAKPAKVAEAKTADTKAVKGAEATPVAPVEAKRATAVASKPVVSKPIEPKPVEPPEAKPAKVAAVKPAADSKATADTPSNAEHNLASEHRIAKAKAVEQRVAKAETRPEPRHVKPVAKVAQAERSEKAEAKTARAEQRTSRLAARSSDDEVRSAQVRQAATRMLRSPVLDGDDDDGDVRPARQRRAQVAHGYGAQQRTRRVIEDD